MTWILKIFVKILWTSLLSKGNYSYGAMHLKRRTLKTWIKVKSDGFERRNNRNIWSYIVNTIFFYNHKYFSITVKGNRHSCAIFISFYLLRWCLKLKALYKLSLINSVTIYCWWFKKSLSSNRLCPGVDFYQHLIVKYLIVDKVLIAIVTNNICYLSW